MQGSLLLLSFTARVPNFNANFLASHRIAAKDSYWRATRGFTELLSPVGGPASLRAVEGGSLRYVLCEVSSATTLSPFNPTTDSHLHSRTLHSLLPSRRLLKPVSAPLMSSSNVADQARAQASLRMLSFAYCGPLLCCLQTVSSFVVKKVCPRNHRFRFEMDEGVIEQEGTDWWNGN